MKTTYKKGFTLIEMLVVIAIIAILTGIVITNLTSAKSKSRDAKRISDIGQMQLTLEQFFDRCGLYPASFDLQTATCSTSSGTVKLGDFISTKPTPPTVGGGTYDYHVNSAKTDYLLHTKLENNIEAVKDSIKEGEESSDFSSETCHLDSNTDYCVGPK